MIRGTDLEKVAPFADLSTHEREIFAAAAEEVSTGEPTVIIAEGDEGSAFYVLLDGKVEVSKRGPRGAPQVLANLGPGSIFGELALFDPGSRSATVKTRGPARLARFSYEEFERIAEMDPAVGYRFLKAVIRTLASRLRAAGDQVRDHLVWTLGPVVR